MTTFKGTTVHEQGLSFELELPEGATKEQAEAIITILVEYLGAEYYDYDHQCLLMDVKDDVSKELYDLMDSDDFYIHSKIVHGEHRVDTLRAK